MTQATGNPLIGPLLPRMDPADKSPYKQFVVAATIVARYGEFRSCQHIAIDSFGLNLGGIISACICAYPLLRIYF